MQSKLIVRFRQVSTHAEQIKNGQPQRVETCAFGDGWAQGDLLLVCLEHLPRMCQPIEEPGHQLAPGLSQGSRHCLDSLDGVSLYNIKDPTPLDGPIIVTEREFTVLHPEHGDITLPAGVWGVVYQRAFADELRRVQD